MSPVRMATTDDIPELIRLRAVMTDSFTSWGTPPEGEDWRAACAKAMAAYLDGDQMRIFVVDADNADDGLAACGIGTLDPRLPNAYNPSGLVGYVLGMVTDSRHRRRGYAKAIMMELLRWFTEQGVGRVDLSASEDAIALYRGLGFVQQPDPRMSLKLR